ncbi:MAG: FeoB-associated Cys-rich membrane protein [Clostridia bacterium]|nr:FeoB-associated Cys-rich membrane protein [Clostridia bacterium]
MKNAIVSLVLIGIAAAIVWHLIRAKQRGETCIGCPYAKQCGGKCGSGSIAADREKHS